MLFDKTDMNKDKSHSSVEKTNKLLVTETNTLFFVQRTNDDTFKSSSL